MKYLLIYINNQIQLINDIKLIFRDWCKLNGEMGNPKNCKKCVFSYRYSSLGCVGTFKSKI